MKALFSFFKSRLFLINVGLAILFVIIGLFVFSKILELYTHHNDVLEMPDFKNISIYELDKYVGEKGFEYVIIDSVSVPGKPRGIVIEQEPPVKSKVKPGRKIYFTVTTVLPEKTIMPNLIDLSLREAVVVLENHGLKLGRVEYIPDVAHNAVLKQKFRGENIAPGTPILKGSTISIVVGRKESNEVVSVPNLVGKTRKEAIAEINSYKLSVGPEHFAINADTSTCKVVKQVPSASEKSIVRVGTLIELWYR